MTSRSLDDNQSMAQSRTGCAITRSENIKSPLGNNGSTAASPLAKDRNSGNHPINLIPFLVFLFLFS